MRHPQLIVLAFDDWLGKQLAEFASDHRWLLKEVRQTGACLALLREPRPTVLLAQLDPHANDPAAPLVLLADVHLRHPHVATALVSDVKLNEDERVAWTATAFDLGARFVLFPPLSRPVLEDLVGGLMASRIDRTTGEADVPLPKPRETVIDLAEEGAAE
ncbi:hypothetical protein [Limnoglobus roseus]|uniref:Response regulatory domain-containing protein n=1 Tax=Limnoglobus roseus TaxID=2598579 RepID=A0A5C1AME5_9BACT|nr:hypothetical protein [Limnoglobus roseus]QEL19755.1 hypothetical protein PX52LOC_06834 [Limnoglobus roseus]